MTAPYDFAVGHIGPCPLALRLHSTRSLRRGQTRGPLPSYLRPSHLCSEFSLEEPKPIRGTGTCKRIEQTRNESRPSGFDDLPPSPRRCLRGNARGTECSLATAGERMAASASRT